MVKKKAPPNAFSVACHTAARDQRPPLAVSITSTIIWKPAFPTMPTVQGSWPPIISGRCQKMRMADRIAQAPISPCRSSSTGAAKAVQPASSPSPTSTSMTRNVTGISGQRDSWSVVGSGAPRPWLISTMETCTTTGASTARAYQPGAALQVRSCFHQAARLARPWHPSTTRAASTGPSGLFSGYWPTPNAARR